MTCARAQADFDVLGPVAKRPQIKVISMEFIITSQNMVLRAMLQHNIQTIVLTVLQ